MSALAPHLEPVAYDPFAGPVLESFLPITESQREIWLATQMSDDLNLAYNEGLDITLRGPLDESALKGALQSVISRHEALRGFFSPDGASMMVLSHLPLEAVYTTHDLRNEGNSAQALAALEARAMATPFNVETGPLVRFMLVRLADEDYRLFFIAHHIVCDGWSCAVVITEIGALYSTAVEGIAHQLQPAPRYGDYSLIEQEFRHSDEGLRHEQYWLDKLKNPPANVDLPLDRARPKERDVAAGRIDHRLSVELVTNLRRTGAAHGASLVSIMLAGFAALLNRLTGSEDLVIGLCAAGQSQHQISQLVGHCVNKLPLRLKPQHGMQFTDFLKSVRGEVLDAQDHQGVTYGSLLPKIALERDDSRPLLIGITFNIDVRDDDIRHAGLQVSYRTMVRKSDNQELYFNVVDNGQDLVLEVCYSAGLFTADTIRRRVDEYSAILEAICVAPNSSIAALPLITTSEQVRLQNWSKGPVAGLPKIQTLHRLFEEQAARTPDAPAVLAESGRMSYRELNHRANQLAHWLRTQGVGRDVCVGICAQRSTELVVALLGTLKAGGAYLPLDPEYPAERLAYMLADASPAVVLVGLPDSEFGESARSVMSAAICPQLDLSDATLLHGLPGENPPDDVLGDALAYVTYTSGSTGKPKGAMLEHRGVVNLLLGFQQRHPLTADDRILQKTPYSFDPSVWEFFWPLMTGAALVLAKPEGHKDPAYLCSLIQRERITMMHFVPSMLSTFLDMPDAAACTSLHRVFCGGEALRGELASRFQHILPKTQLYNMYGPVEATVDVSQWHWQGSPLDQIVPIGRPLPNVQLHVLDNEGGILPVGVAGELHIGGMQLARGYLNRPELTAERFIQHPRFGRLYRTGDLCRWNADGAIEFLGRLDFQVKLRGFRIELGEIEASLRTHADVAECAAAVIEKTPGDARLVAWIVLRNGGSVTGSELRAQLRQELPDYMIPQQFVTLEQLPLTPSGKLDRRALPNPFAGAIQEVKVAVTPPATAMEQDVAEIWKDVLGVNTINREDRFLDLGGHSLLAVKVTVRLRERFGVRLPLRVVMTHPLHLLAAAIDPTTEAVAVPVLTAALEPAAHVDPQPQQSGGLMSKLRKLLK